MPKQEARQAPQTKLSEDFARRKVSRYPAKYLCQGRAGQYTHTHCLQAPFAFHSAATPLHLHLSTFPQDSSHHSDMFIPYLDCPFSHCFKGPSLFLGSQCPAISSQRGETEVFVCLVTLKCVGFDPFMWVY